ncbi:MAG: hypothetical protein HY735_12875, partial [Verrucomicrobia bacterium]|nr:hypothetical protein [Verrucomicrobiota bacterium]
MKTIAKIIALHGGLAALREDYIRIENEPFMRLVIEHVGEGLSGKPLISVAHYGELNGDAMRDPDMTFEIAEIDGVTNFHPITYQNDYLGVYQEAVWVSDGKLLARPRLIRELASFARQWDRNIKEQGFLEADQRQ